jgi:hypothetical protein
MEQTYWLSPALEQGTDTRLLLYRYGNFVYAGPVITEPVKGLEYLPGVLAGIQAVQGQVPYLCEVGALASDSPHGSSLLTLQRALDCVHSELERHTDKLAALAGQEGNVWLDAEDAAVYFEFETLAGYTCNVRLEALLLLLSSLPALSLSLTSLSHLPPSPSTPRAWRHLAEL